MVGCCTMGWMDVGGNGREGVRGVRGGALRNLSRIGSKRVIPQNPEPRKVCRHAITHHPSPLREALNGTGFQHHSPMDSRAISVNVLNRTDCSFELEFKSSTRAGAKFVQSSAAIHLTSFYMSTLHANHLRKSQGPEGWLRTTDHNPF